MTIGAAGAASAARMVQALPRRERNARSHFSATFQPISRSSTTLSRKERFYAPRECLLRLWQTDNRREHIVPMVRTAEEVVLGPPRGGIESRRAFRLRVPCQTRAHPSTLTLVQEVRRGGLGDQWAATCRQRLTGSVLEPATWAMMGLGFATLGFAGYRRRRARLWRLPSRAGARFNGLRYCRRRSRLSARIWSDHTGL